MCNSRVELRSVAGCWVVLAALLGSCGEDEPAYAPRAGGPQSSSSSSSGGTSSGSSSSSSDDPDDSPGAAGAGSAPGTLDCVDTSNVNRFDSGFDPDDMLAALNAGEIGTLCTRARQYFTRTITLTAFERSICYTDSGGAAAATRGACEDLVDQCLASTSFDYLGCSLDPLTRTDVSIGCMATVDEYERCMTEAVSIAKAESQFFSCATSDDAEAPPQVFATPCACDLLLLHCEAL